MGLIGLLKETFEEFFDNSGYLWMNLQCFHGFDMVRDEDLSGRWMRSSFVELIWHRFRKMQHLLGREIKVMSKPFSRTNRVMYDLNIVSEPENQ